MDFQHRPGGKTGSGGVASWSETNRERRERLRQLALESIDLQKDPYFMKNHLGSYECKLCLTLHNNEGSYLAHTQGKKHQTNLARRQAKDSKDSPALPAPAKPRTDIRKFVKIGRPGYRVTKQLDQETGQQSLLFQVDYPEITDGIVPRHRFMSAYEQKIEPPDRRWQYVLFAAEPYETIGFKVPSREVDKSEDKFWTLWNKDSKQFFLQVAFKVEPGNPSIMASVMGPNKSKDMSNNQPSKPSGPKENFNGNNSLAKNNMGRSSRVESDSNNAPTNNHENNKTPEPTTSDANSDNISANANNSNGNGSNDSENIEAEEADENSTDRMPMEES